MSEVNSTNNCCPAAWDEFYLSDLISSDSSITYGVVQPGPEVPDGVLFVRGGDIFNGKIFIEKLRTISKEISLSYKRTLLSGGELVMSLVGYPGEVAIVPTALKGANIARQTALIRLSDKASNKFVMYYLLSENGKYFLFEKSTGSAQQVINLADLRYVKVFLPPLPQQKKIAKILTTVDNLIEQTQALIDKYTAIKQGMMADLFTRGIDLSGTPETNPNHGQLRPSFEEAPELYKETELGWVPRDWEVGAINDYLSQLIDYRGKTPIKTSEGIPLVTAKNVRMGYVDPLPREYIAVDNYVSWMTRGIPEVGDILFTTEAPLGNVAQILSNEKMAFAQRVIILRTNDKCNNIYFKYLLMSDGFRKTIFSRGSGSTVEGVKQSEFRKTKVPVPKSVEEQLIIADQLSAIDLYLIAENKNLDKYLKIKKGLMQDLLTGKVQVTA